MSEDNKDVQFILGELSGKMDGLTSSVNQVLVALTAHTASDEKNFKEIREEVSNVKIMVARYAGGAAVLGALAGAIIPIIIQQVIK
jgi:hypothetical protein